MYHTLIGFSIHGKTYFFLNTFSKKELNLLTMLTTNYRQTNFSQTINDDILMNHFIQYASTVLNISLFPVNIDKILIIK